MPGRIGIYMRSVNYCSIIRLIKGGSLDSRDAACARTKSVRAGGKFLRIAVIFNDLRRNGG